MSFLWVTANFGEVKARRCSVCGAAPTTTGPCLHAICINLSHSTVVITRLPFIVALIRLRFSVTQLLWNPLPRMLVYLCLVRLYDKAVTADHLIRIDSLNGQAAKVLESLKKGISSCTI